MIGNLLPPCEFCDISAYIVIGMTFRFDKTVLIRYHDTQITDLHLHRFTARRSMKTLTNHIFS